MKYLESWNKWECECGTINWTNEGNVCGMSGYDTEAIKCHNCGKVDWVDESIQDIICEETEDLWDDPDYKEYRRNPENVAVLGLNVVK